MKMIFLSIGFLAGVVFATKYPIWRTPSRSGCRPIRSLTGADAMTILDRLVKKLVRAVLIAALCGG